MSNKDHVDQSKQGVEVWNEWRQENPDVIPDLSYTDLRGLKLCGVNLSDANLHGANLFRVDLSNADLRGANLFRADLSSANLDDANLGGANLGGANLHGANLSDANLGGANLHGVDLHDANLFRANLFGADLHNVNLFHANLLGADLRSANLFGADLGDASLFGVLLLRADLRGAKLFHADLTGADLRGADLSVVNLRQAALIDTRLDGANLTGAKLWETQRGGWSIKGVICQRAFWDREGEKADEYEDGAFERIFAEKQRIVLRYPGGISPVELAMLPVIVERLQAEHPDCALHIRSVQDDGSGATVTITVDDLKGRSTEIFSAEIDVLRRDVVDYQERWRLSDRNLYRIEAKYEELKENFNRIADMPKYVVGQAGAVGDHAHAHDMTFQQIQGGIDLPKLAEELGRLRDVMKQETEGTVEHDEAIAEVGKAERAAAQSDGPTALRHLKAAKAVGKWTLGVAERIGVAVAAEAIKRAM
jgi:uncharacterized protein YjbI with pentapeptide repeats